MAVHVLVVEDHAQFCDLLCRMVATIMPDATVTAVGALAPALHCSPPPDVVLLDLHLPDCNDLSGLARMRLAFPSARVALLTGDDRPEIIDGARLGGAATTIDKGLSDASFEVRLRLLLGLPL